MNKFGENPWPGDLIEGQTATGGISRAMAAGGQTVRWGGTCNRFSEGDLRLKSMYGFIKIGRSNGLSRKIQL